MVRVLNSGGEAAVAGGAHAVGLAQTGEAPLEAAYQEYPAY